MPAASPLAYTARSRVSACAPVPDSGQSSSVMPLRASRACARSLAASGSVLVSATIVPLPAPPINAAQASSSAASLGSDRTMNRLWRATSVALPHGVPPAVFSRARAFATGS